MISRVVVVHAYGDYPAGDEVQTYMHTDLLIQEGGDHRLTLYIYIYIYLCYRDYDHGPINGMQIFDSVLREGYRR